MSRSESPPDLSGRQQYALLAVAALLALVVGLVVAPTVHGTVSSATDSSDEQADSIVAVVSIDGPITGASAEPVEEELAEIRSNESVEAVVLEMDTGGGDPAGSERMYSAIERTSEEMPVIASVQGASASGGYYAMLGADDIYTKPTSIIGSIGVAASAPEQSPPVEGPTGPDKLGDHEIQDLETINLLDEVFLNAVMEERGDRIDLPREQVGTGEVFLGVEAVDNGFADEIGSLDEAVEDAADRADVEEYAIDKRASESEMELPIFARTDDGIVEIHESNPGFGDIEPVQYAYVYEDALPHIDTIEEVGEIDVEGVTAESGGEQP